MGEINTTVNKNTVENLFKAGAHFAFAKSRRHPSAKPFIFGAKNKVEIFDLEKTAKHLQKATDFVAKLASEGKQILFVGGKSEARGIIETSAQSINMPYVAGRWLGGTFTNFTEIKKRVEKMTSWLSQKEKGELVKYTKKERLLIDREIEKLQSMFAGLVLMKDLPKAIFVIDAKREHIAVSEARKAGIPVVALCGSDCDLGEVDYFIPANDGSVASINFFVNEIVKAYKDASDIVKEAKTSK